MKVFVSYCHRQGPWVLGTLVPCLKAGGVEVLVDAERFRAGHALVGQMDALADQAEKSLLVLSAGYFASEYCRHELARAVARDPGFARGFTVPVLFEPCTLPDALAKAEPLRADLLDPLSAPGWKLVLDAAGADLGCPAPRWIQARDELVDLLGRNRSVNFVVPHRDGGARPKWRELIAHLKDRHFADLGCVDLERGAAASRQGLVELILDAVGHRQAVPAKPRDLAVLDRALHGRGAPPKLAMLHFDMAVPRLDEYGVDLFAAMRSLVEDGKMVLMVHSRRPFMELAPREHPLSEIQLAFVELDCP